MAGAGSREARGLVYFDRRLWALTVGVRGRIAFTVLVGLAAVAAGIARLALLGWLLARVLAGDSLAALTPALVLTASALVGRSALDYARTMVAHRTAALVQQRLRQLLYEHVAVLGPAHFVRDRTGEVMLSLVEGVQQLEVYFGQYLPQLFVSALTPILIFAFVAFLDLPVALVFLITALVTLLAPTLWHAWDSKASLARNRAYGAFGAEFLDALQGLATLKAFGQSGARARRLEERAHALFKSTMWVLGTNTLARGITDTGIAVGAAAALALGAWRVGDGSMSLPALLIILMLGVEVFRPLRELRTLLHQGMLGLSASRGIFALLDATPAVTDRAAGPEPRRRRRGLRGRDLLLPWGPPARPRRDQLRGTAGRAGGHRGGERLGQVHRRAAAAALLRSRARPRDHRRPRSARAEPRPGARADRRREPGHLALPRDRRGKSADGPTRRDRRAAAGGGPGGQRRGVHPPPAAGLRHGRRRARPAAVGRSAAAHRHRARIAARRADPRARRGAVVGGRRERGAHPGRARPPDGGAHHARRSPTGCRA